MLAKVHVFKDREERKEYELQVEGAKQERQRGKCEMPQAVRGALSPSTNHEQVQ